MNFEWTSNEPRKKMMIREDESLHLPTHHFTFSTHNWATHCVNMKTTSAHISLEEQTGPQNTKIEIKEETKSAPTPSMAESQRTTDKKRHSEPHLMVWESKKATFPDNSFRKDCWMCWGTKIVSLGTAGANSCTQTRLSRMGIESRFCCCICCCMCASFSCMTRNSSSFARMALWCSVLSSELKRKTNMKNEKEFNFDRNAESCGEKFRPFSEHFFGRSKRKPSMHSNRCPSD